MECTQRDLEAIGRLAADWRVGWLTGDVDLLLSLYADDPVLMPQDQPAVAGKAAIRALYEPVLRDYRFRSDSRVEEVVAAGDWGYFWSTYRLTATPKAGGPPFRSAGKSLFVVRRALDGSWKIARLMDNSDGPAAADDGAAA